MGIKPITHQFRIRYSTQSATPHLFNFFFHCEFMIRLDCNLPLYCLLSVLASLTLIGAIIVILLFLYLFLSFVCPHFSRSSTHVCNCCMFDYDLYLIKSIHTLFCSVLIVIGEAISRLVWNFKFSFLYSSKKTPFIILLPICFHSKLMHSNTQLQQNMQGRILLFQSPMLPCI